MVKWTARLKAAAAAIASERSEPRHKDVFLLARQAKQDDDVRSRCREVADMRVGDELQPFQHDYMKMLLQRLDLDHDKPRATHTEFKAAWNEAWDASRAAPLPTYHWHINLDERGEFYADVRMNAGEFYADRAETENTETVYEVRGFDIFEDGFMRDKRDMRGLTAYLIDLGVIPKGAVIYDEERS